ncbi:MAG: metallophosphoesterase [Candidatus Moranbacteria bacterium]|nr:metallophosphoesterase [Candidatus Moranbacteria bacterium]
MKKSFSKLNLKTLLAIFASTISIITTSILAGAFFDASENQSFTKTLSQQETPDTVPQKPKLFSFVAIGDSEKYKGPDGYDTDVLSVFAKARELHPDLIFLTGDIITASTESLQENFRRIRNIKNVLNSYFLPIPYYITFGYHDLECGLSCANQWSQSFFGKPLSETKLYHSFDYENTHFVILSNDYPLRKNIEKEQLNWLEKDLSENTKQNTIIFMHVPPVTFFKASANDCHDMSCSEPTRTQLVSILEKHSVDLVISGHEHLFDHKIVNGINYVLSGNATGSKPRYKNTLSGENFIQIIVSGQSITLRALKNNGDLIRSIKIK